MPRNLCGQPLRTEGRAGTNFGGRKWRRKGRGTEEEMKSRERGEREKGGRKAGRKSGTEAAGVHHLPTL